MSQSSGASTVRTFSVDSQPAIVASQAVGSTPWMIRAYSTWMLISSRMVRRAKRKVPTPSTGSSKSVLLG
ncbi:hypothetical protein D3C76_824010 [compost metagenome]